MDDKVLFEIVTFRSPQSWEKRQHDVIGSTTDMAVFIVTVPKDDVPEVVEWLIYNNPSLVLDFHKGLNEKHADNFIHNRASILFTAVKRN